MLMRNVSVRVDAGETAGALRHNWRYIGYDECNYTTTPEGGELLRKFGELLDAPYYVRVHHLFCNGNGLGVPKWGSTNIFAKDSDGNPVYDYTVFDRIIEAILARGHIPFLELGFMPLDMAEQSYRSSERWSFETFFEYKDKGWRTPPADYGDWRALVYSAVRHCVERWGRENVERWYFELWNEPDLRLYWLGTPEEYFRLYDYTEAAVHEALPSARLAGPATTGPLPGSPSAEYLDGFLKHCREGKNYITGQTGTRLDFITFHVKGGGFVFTPRPEKGHPSVKYLLEQVRTGCGIIKSNGYSDREIVLSECDPDGWAAGGRFDNPNLSFRNTEYYASYIASSYHGLEALADGMGMDVRPLAWAFLFPGERCFEGTRVFSTQGIDKPCMNLFRMLARLEGDSVTFTSDGERDWLAEPDGGEIMPDVSGRAAVSEDGVLRILVYSHHDDPDFNGETGVTLTISGLEASEYTLSHTRIDSEFSNACAAWVREGMPDYPDAETYGRIKARDGLEEIGSSLERPDNGELTIGLKLPARGISLFELVKAT